MRLVYPSFPCSVGRDAGGLGVFVVAEKGFHILAFFLPQGGGGVSEMV
jgi:hypothetical protein